VSGDGHVAPLSETSGFTTTAGKLTFEPRDFTFEVPGAVSWSVFGLPASNTQTGTRRLLPGRTSELTPAGYPQTPLAVHRSC